MQFAYMCIATKKLNLIFFWQNYSVIKNQVELKLFINFSLSKCQILFFLKLTNAYCMGPVRIYILAKKNYWYQQCRNNYVAAFYFLLSFRKWFLKSRQKVTNKTHVKRLKIQVGIEKKVSICNMLLGVVKRQNWRQSADREWSL